MASFYMDENVSLALETSLQQHGHTVASAFSERRLGAPDPHQLLYAAERGWTLITHNRRDFKLLHDAWLLWSNAWQARQTHAGILVLEQVPGQSVRELVGLILALATAPGFQTANALYDWNPAKGWQRFPR